MSSEQRMKVLEDIQRAKRLLKEGTVTSLGMGMHTSASQPLATPPTPGYQYQSQQHVMASAGAAGDMSHGMRSAMQILSQANMSSFGYFVPQDSQFGNSIMPVLPRLTPPTNNASDAKPQ